MKQGYPREAYDNPSFLDALNGVGPYDVAEVLALTAPVRHRRARHSKPWDYWALVVVFVVCAVVVVALIGGAL